MGLRPIERVNQVVKQRVEAGFGKQCGNGEDEETDIKRRYRRCERRRYRLESNRPERATERRIPKRNEQRNNEDGKTQRR
jgi:hypothetical protein